MIQNSQSGELMLSCALFKYFSFWRNKAAFCMKAYIGSCSRGTVNINTGAYKRYTRFDQSPPSHELFKTSLLKHAVNRRHKIQRRERGLPAVM